jgi:uncharacterized protein YcfL
MRLALLATSLLLLATGCGVNPPIQGRADPYPRQQIHFDSQELRNDTAIDAPLLTHNESGQLMITIPIRSTIDKTLHIDYRITYFDRNGAVLGRVGPLSKHLLPNTPDQIQVTSPFANTADFQVDFYYSR